MSKFNDISDKELLDELAKRGLSKEVRTEQVNIRLTLDEKHRLEKAAMNQGFPSISAYLRHRGLQEI